MLVALNPSAKQDKIQVTKKYRNICSDLRDEEIGERTEACLFFDFNLDHRDAIWKMRFAQSRVTIPDLMQFE